MLEKEDPVPLYHSVMDDLRRKIQDNIYPAGHSLPTENELSKIYNVSRITVRRAISELSNEKLIRKIHGKGTFALQAPIQEEIISISGYSEMFKKRDMDISNKILEIATTQPLAKIQKQLQIEAHDAVLMIKRLHIVHDRPFAIDTSYFEHQKFSALPSHLSDNISLYSVLQAEFNVIPKHAERYFSAKMITPAERKLLDAGKEPVFKIEKTVMDENRNIIHFSQLITPSSLATYHISY